MKRYKRTTDKGAWNDPAPENTRGILTWGEWCAHESNKRGNRMVVKSAYGRDTAWVEREASRLVEIPDKLWEKFAKSGLVTGAWSGMDWKDLPDHVQDEFLEFTREVRRAFCMH
jgi:hypothetical protein